MSHICHEIVTNRFSMPTNAIYDRRHHCIWDVQKWWNFGQKNSIGLSSWNESWLTNYCFISVWMTTFDLEFCISGSGNNQWIFFINALLLLLPNSTLIYKILNESMVLIIRRQFYSSKFLPVSGHFSRIYNC